jgi:multidrug efflux pump subunit AcrA (membrane-fusion protein)
MKNSRPATQRSFNNLRLFSKEMARQKWAGLAALIFLGFPLQTTVSTAFILEPGAKSVVRAPVAGLVTQVPVADGQAVAAGTVLARLANPELADHEAHARAELNLASHSLAEAAAGNDSGAIARYTQERNRWTAQLAEVQTRLAGLVLGAPSAGDRRRPPWSASGWVNISPRAKPSPSLPTAAP